VGLGEHEALPSRDSPMQRLSQRVMLKR